MKKVELDKNVIVHEYVDLGMGAGAIAKKHKTAPKRIRAIIDEFGIEHKKAGSQVAPAEKVVDAKTQKYPPINGKVWVVYDPNTDFTSTDIGNKSGFLTSYIEKQYGVPTPPNYDRTKYYTSTGNYWWEQWLKVRCEDINTETRLTRWASLDKEAIYQEYLNGNLSINALAQKYRVGKKRIEELIKEKGVSRKDVRGKTITDRYKDLEHRKPKYQPADEDSYLVVYDPNTDFMTTDTMNRGGHLTTYIEKQYGVPTPSFYERSVYYIKTGNYWWEQWLKVKSIKKRDVKVCPFCGWATVDVENNSGWFSQHLMREHNITIENYLMEYPEDKKYFYYANPTKNTALETDPKKFVKCPLCGIKYRNLAYHLGTIHGISKLDFKLLYEDTPLACEENIEISKENAKKANKNAKFTKHSSYETVIVNIINKAGLECHSDRHILDGKEIDILISSLNLGIEIDGCNWHTENQGKNENYHLNKTLECRENGIKLVHIFDDEIHYRRRIITSRVRHLIQANCTLQKVDGKKCVIQSISQEQAIAFLDRNHLEKGVEATLHLGAYHNNMLIGVMSFQKEPRGQWTIVRFATHVKFLCRGVGGKLFAHFTRTTKYKQVFATVDRRWCLDEANNIFTKIGFAFDSYVSPDFKYYKQKLTGGKRVDKSQFSKKELRKKYGNQLPSDMTEAKAVEKLGLERIWDCGQIRYVYTNPSNR